MNLWVCDSKDVFEIPGRLNEDTTVYTNNAATGDIYFSTNFVSINQATTQSQEGGLTDAYLKLGTYTKSYYSMMFRPSAVKVQFRPDMKRIHHTVAWNLTTPMILREEYKK